MNKMSTYLRVRLAEESGNDEMLFADGFDKALVGHTTKGCAVYSREKILNILCDDDMTYEDALEHFYYNIDGAYVGKYTPIFICPTDYIDLHNK